MATNVKTIYKSSELNLPWRNEVNQIVTAYDTLRPRKRGERDYSPLIVDIVDNCTLSVSKIAKALKERKGSIMWAMELMSRSPAILKEIETRKTQAEIDKLDAVLTTSIGHKLTHVNVGKFQRLTVEKANLETKIKA